MNPYAPGSQLQADADFRVIEPLTLRERSTAFFVVSLLSASVGVFVFFGLIESLGLGVNWPNVLPLLNINLVVMMALVVFLRPFLRKAIRIWAAVRYTVAGGVLFGSVAAVLAYLRVI